MPDLVLLCAGAASDREPDAGAFDALGAAEAAASLRDGAFARALRRASVTADTRDEAALPRETPDEAWLRAAFGVPEADSVEAWSAAADGVALPAWQAVPCNVQVGHYQLVLTDPDELRLDAADAGALADAVRELFGAAGFTIDVTDPLRWHLCGNGDWDLSAHARTMAVGRSIDGYLPKGPRARDWRRLFTECQIAWHEHPVNLRRESTGLRPVNALWLDGCARGPLPATPRAVVSVDTPIAGLAKASGARLIETHWQALTRERLAEAARIGGSGGVLVDVSAWRVPRRRGDRAAWQDGWRAYDRWLAGTGLAAGWLPDGIDGLRVVLGGERRLLELHRARRAAWRFWRTLDAVDAVLGR